MTKHLALPIISAKSIEMGLSLNSPSCLSYAITLKTNTQIIKMQNWNSKDQHQILRRKVRVTNPYLPRSNTCFENHQIGNYQTQYLSKKRHEKDQSPVPMLGYNEYMFLKGGCEIEREDRTYRFFV